MNRTLACLLAFAVLAGAASARADEARPPEGVVSLSSSASVDVPKDWMSVTFSVTREGADAAAVQNALRDALDAALAQARLAQKRASGEPGQVELHTGGFSLQPRYNAKGAMSGWSGTTELVAEGRDLATLGGLTGQVATMTVSGIDFGVSREARERVEGELAAQAIARFRAKAADYAKAFGYAGYVVREVNVQTGSSAPPMPRMYAMKAAAADVAGEGVPVEAGKGTVTSSVNGSVQLLK